MSEKKDTNSTKLEEKKEQLLTCEMFCNIAGVSVTDRRAIELKYSSTLYSLEKWVEIVRDEISLKNI